MADKISYELEFVVDFLGFFYMFFFFHLMLIFYCSITGALVKYLTKVRCKPFVGLKSE